MCSYVCMCKKFNTINKYLQLLITVFLHLGHVAVCRYTCTMGAPYL